MNIFILDESPQAIAQALDDRSLNEQIEASAQVLVNVWYKLRNTAAHANKYADIRSLLSQIPQQDINNEWSEWLKLSPANYGWLMNLFDFLLLEQSYRFCDLPFYGKYYDFYRSLLIINPDSRLPFHTFFPLVVTDEYNLVKATRKISYDIAIADYKKLTVESYRNYFRSVVKDPKYTRREPPAWRQF
jgi:hypothetical protein